MSLVISTLFWKAHSGVPQEILAVGRLSWVTNLLFYLRQSISKLHYFQGKVPLRWSLFRGLRDGALRGWGLFAVVTSKSYVVCASYLLHLFLSCTEINIHVHCMIFVDFFFLLVSCRLLLPFSIHSEMSRLAFGGTFHMHAQGCESFRLLWSSVTGGRLSAARFQGLLISTSPSHSQPKMPKAVRLQPHCPPTNVSLSYDEYLRTYFVG